MMTNFLIYNKKIKYIIINSLVINLYILKNINTFAEQIIVLLWLV